MASMTISPRLQAQEMARQEEVRLCWCQSSDTAGSRGVFESLCILCLCPVCVVSLCGTRRVRGVGMVAEKTFLGCSPAVGDNGVLISLLMTNLVTQNAALVYTSTARHRCMQYMQHRCMQYMQQENHNRRTAAASSPCPHPASRDQIHAWTWA